MSLVLLWFTSNLLLKTITIHFPAIVDTIVTHQRKTSLQLSNRVSSAPFIVLKVVGAISGVKLHSLLMCDVKAESDCMHLCVCMCTSALFYVLMNLQVSKCRSCGNHR